VFSHTESKIYHCAAWPWSDDFPGVTNPSHFNSSRLSNVENSGIPLENSLKNGCQSCTLG